MNVQRHHDDERLIEILEADRSFVRDAHLDACASCSEALESYREITGILREKSAWKREPEPRNDATLAAIRTFAASLQSEAAAAAAMIGEITSLPRQWWAMKVAAESRFQTAALARALSEKSEAAIDSMPPDAVELARAATIAADATGDRLTTGSAYRQFAYALFYTGDIAGSLKAIDKSAAALASTASSEYELARLDIVRSVVFTATEQFDLALDAARRAQRGFRAFGDQKRNASAMLAEAFVLLSQSRYREALVTLTAINQALLDDDGRARVTANLALCQWQTGNVVDALQTYELAALLYENVPTENARIRLNIAGVLSSQGRTAEAKAKLQQLRNEFAGLSMQHAVLSCDLLFAEILLAEGAYAQAEELCRAAVEEYGRSRIAYQTEILTALTYLQEASTARRATPETVRHIKKYIERLPYEPNLLFAPPPLAPE